MRTRELVPRKDAPIPVPLKYTSHEKLKGATRVVEINFKEPKINATHALRIDAKAAELVEEAWKQRYVLPQDIRLTKAARTP